VEPHPRYELLEKIASGSYATVYRAKDLELAREVAIKQIHQQYLEDPTQLARFWDEAQLLASFQHPNIVTMYDIDRERGWLVMELMQGNFARMAGKKPMDVNGLRTTLAHCLRALKFLHSHGVIHGDIKPSNIMVDRRKRVKIGDFGLARRASNEEGSLIKGTAKYIAPEVVSDEFGDVGPASDLYSLGFTAYELLCGENFDSLFPGLSAFGRDKQIAWMMWHAAPDRRLPEIARVLEGVPEDLAHTIDKLIKKPQAERYKSADEALSDLNIDLKVIKTGEEPSAETEKAGAAEAKKRRMLLFGAVGFSLILSLGVLFLPSGENPKAPTDIDKEPAKIGILREVLPDQKTIVVETGDAAIPEEIPVGDKPRIHFNQEKYVLLRELKKGDYLEIRTKKSPNGTSDVQIDALRAEESRGRIKKVDPDDRLIELSIEEGTSRETFPLRIPPGAKVTLNERTAELADLRPDDIGRATHLKETQGRSGRRATSLAAYRKVRMIGVLREVQGEKGQLAIEPIGDDRPRTFPVAERCKIVLNGDDTTDGRVLSVGDLKPGDRVNLQHDTHILELRATRLTNRTGTIREISKDAGSLLLSASDGQMVTIGIPRSAEITLGQQSVNLDDLRVYDRADVMFSNANGQPAAVTLDVIRPAKRDRVAIVIGIQDYTDPHITRIHHPTRDARLVAETLQRRYAFSSDRVLLLTDPKRAALEKAVSDFLGNFRTRQVQVLVYFAGHAYVGSNPREPDKKQVYLAAKDTDWNRLPETGLKLEWLTQQLHGMVAQEKILLLDASHEGARTGTDLSQQPSTAEMIEVLNAAGDTSLQSVAILASCSQGQTGHVDLPKQLGLFATSLSEAFTGAADQNRDLLIDSRELFEFVNQKLSTGRGEGGAQTPVLFGGQ
jgi:serine/threonine-protein kinase